jgi:hypothetical protein
MSWCVLPPGDLAGTLGEADEDPHGVRLDFYRGAVTRDLRAESTSTARLEKPFCL